MNAVRSGRHRRIALELRRLVKREANMIRSVPRTLIDGTPAARQVAGKLLQAPGPIPGFTLISGAIDFARQMLAGVLVMRPIAT